MTELDGLFYVQLGLNCVQLVNKQGGSRNHKLKVCPFSMTESTGLTSSTGILPWVCTKILYYTLCAFRHCAEGEFRRESENRFSQKIFICRVVRIQVDSCKRK